MMWRIRWISKKSLRASSFTLVKVVETVAPAAPQYRMLSVWVGVKVSNEVSYAVMRPITNGVSRSDPRSKRALIS